MRKLVCLLLPRLPRSLRVLVARKVLGWEIHPTARLGRSLIQVDHLRMGPHSSIGPRNVIKGLEELSLGAFASIGGRNTIGGFPPGFPIYPDHPDRRSALILHDYAGITVGHEIDCSDTFELEHHAVLGGFGCVVLTHSIDIRTNRWRVAPVRFRHHALVLNGSTIMVGVTLAPAVVVSANSVVSRDLDQEYMLYRGNPVEPWRQLDESYLMQSRPGEWGIGAPPDAATT